MKGIMECDLIALQQSLLKSMNISRKLMEIIEEQGLQYKYSHSIKTLSEQMDLIQIESLKVQYTLQVIRATK